MPKKDLRKFILIINTLALLLFFQNCSFSKNSSQSLDLNLFSEKTNLSGNGGSYDGKQDGFKRLVPGFICHGQKVAFASLDIQNQSAVLTNHDDGNGGSGNCQKSEDIAFADLDFSAFSNKYVGYKDGLYTYLDDVQNSLDQQIFTEAFCQSNEKKLNGEPLFELAIEWNQSGKMARQYFYTNKNSAPVVSQINRIIDLDRVRYSGEVQDQLEIIHTAKIPETFKVMGRYRTMSNPFEGVSISCRLGGQFDLVAPQFSFLNGKSQTAELGRPIQKLVPQINKLPQQFSLDKDLPSGLSFDAKTGIISGTPTQTSVRKIYNVTALFEFGEVTEALSLGIGQSVQVDRLRSNLPTHQQCLTTSSECSLETAIQKANTQAPLPLIVHLTMQNLTLETEFIVSGDLEINGFGTETVLDAQNKSRHFRLEEKAHLSLSQLKLIHGFSQQGGSINSTQADLHLKNVNFEDNKSAGQSMAQGGALYFNGGKLNISDCIFTNNSTPNSGTNIGGGAIYIDQSNAVSIYNSEFNRNQSAYGGAIYAVVPSDRIYEINRSQFINNSSLIRGGAAYFMLGSLRLSEVVFKQNSSSEGGGVYSSMNNNLWLEKIKFDSNSGSIAAALGVWGSLTYLTERGTYILDSEFTGNTNSAYFPNIKANLIVVHEARVAFKNSTLKNNTMLNNCLIENHSAFSKIIDLSGNFSDDSSCPF